MSAREPMFGHDGFHNLGLLDADRPYDTWSPGRGSPRRHHALAVTAHAIRCARCGYVFTGVESELGSEYYRSEHDEAVERLQLAAWWAHVEAQDEIDAKRDREHFAGQVKLQLKLLRERHRDPATAAVLLLTGMTEEQLELAGGMPSTRELAIDAIEELLEGDEDGPCCTRVVSGVTVQAMHGADPSCRRLR